MEIKYIAGKEYKNADSFLRLLILTATAWIAAKDVKKSSLKLPLKKQLQNDSFFRNIYWRLEQRRRHPNSTK
jgi:hypothetical protein